MKLDDLIEKLYELKKNTEIWRLSYGLREMHGHMICIKLI